MSKRCLTCGMHSAENKALKARIAELEKAALAVVEAERQDSNVGLYLERAVDALAALLGGGE